MYTIYILYVYIYICILYTIKYLQNTCRTYGSTTLRPLRVIIAGGGPGGLALARGLVQLPGRPIQSPGEGRELWSYGSLMFLSQGP